MNEKLRKEFVEAYSNNIARVTEEELNEFLDAYYDESCANDEEKLKKHPCLEYMSASGILDSLYMFYDGIAFQEEKSWFYRLKRWWSIFIYFIKLDRFFERKEKI